VRHRHDLLKIRFFSRKERNFFERSGLTACLARGSVSGLARAARGAADAISDRGGETLFEALS
jgi:hypothetical protein